MGVISDVHVEHEPFIPIKIDKTDYKIPVDPNPVNGAYLRQLRSVGSDYDKVHGNGRPRVCRAWTTELVPLTYRSWPSRTPLVSRKSPRPTR